MITITLILIITRAIVIFFVTKVLNVGSNLFLRGADQRDKQLNDFKTKNMIWGWSVEIRV